MSLKVCIVGGIFGMSAAYRSKHGVSPETVLADGLKQRGVKVTTSALSDFRPKAGYDVIHVHHFGRGAVRMAAASTAPFVFTTHDPYSMNGLPVPWKRRLLDGFVLRNATRIVALSRAEQSFLTNTWDLDASRITVIPNGVDSTLFHRPADIAVRSNSNILFVGQLKDFKGVEYLLRAMPAILERHSAAHLTLAYQVDHLLPHLKRIACDLGIQASLSFVGPQDANSLRELYQRAAILAVPSLGECLSTVVLEGMCCGTPVVATDVGGIREQLDEGTGVIVPPRSPEGLSAAISRLLTEQTTRLTMGRAASAKAAASFSVEAMLDRHVNLYAEVQNQAPQRAGAANLFGMAVSKLRLI